MNDVRAKKSLGQNWLVNEGVANRIVAAAGLESGDVVLEVGPGQGILTTRIAPHVSRLVAVEKDIRLIAPLREKLAASPNVQIVEGDILSLDVRRLSFDISGYKLIANLPYYITSHFLRVMLETWPPPTLAVLMVQREVAQRLQAKPGNMNLLALSVGAYARVERVMDVSRGSFRPSPEVDSAVITLEPRSLDHKEKERIRKALAVARQSFGQKRKQLTATVPRERLDACAIPSTARPQELSLQEWSCIAE